MEYELKTSDWRYKFLNPKGLRHVFNRNVDGVFVPSTTCDLYASLIIRAVLYAMMALVIFFIPMMTAHIWNALSLGIISVDAVNVLLIYREWFPSDSVDAGVVLFTLLIFAGLASIISFSIHVGILAVLIGTLLYFSFKGVKLIYASIRNKFEFPRWEAWHDKFDADYVSPFSKICRKIVLVDDSK